MSGRPARACKNIVNYARLDRISFGSNSVFAEAGAQDSIFTMPSDSEENPTEMDNDGQKGAEGAPDQLKDNSDADDVEAQIRALEERKRQLAIEDEKVKRLQTLKKEVAQLESQVKKAARNVLSEGTSDDSVAAVDFPLQVQGESASSAQPGAANNVMTAPNQQTYYPDGRKQRRHGTVQRPAPGETSAVNLQDLRGQRHLVRAAQQQLEMLGLPDDEDDDYDEDSYDKISGKKSGINAKSTDRVKEPQRWPHASFELEFFEKKVAFEDLAFNELVAGEISTILGASEAERLGRLRMLQRINLRMASAAQAVQIVVVASRVG